MPLHASWAVRNAKGSIVGGMVEGDEACRVGVLVGFANQELVDPVKFTGLVGMRRVLLRRSSCWRGTSFRCWSMQAGK